MKKTNKNHKMKRLNRIRSLLILLIIGERTSSILLPSYEPKQWERVNPIDLSCPRIESVKTEVVDISPSQCSRVSRALTRQESGFWCIGVVMITKCTESCFGGTDVVRVSRDNPVSYTECSDALQDFLKGQLSFPAFPPAQCSWCSSNSEEAKSILIVKEDIPYEPLTNLYPLGGIDPTSCDNHHCLTNSRSRMWMRWTTNSESCFLQPENFLLLRNRTGSYLRDSVHRTYSLLSACLTDYCHRPTLYLSGRELLSCESVLLDQLKLKKCPKQIRYEIDPANQDVLAEDQFIQRELVQVKCEDSRERVIKGGSIAPSDLYLMSKKGPGEGYVYFVDNAGVLKRGLTNYREVVAAESMVNLTSSLSSSETIKWSLWTKLTPPGLFMGPNGIVWDETSERLSFPSLFYDRVLNLDVKLANMTQTLSDGADHQTHPGLGSLLKNMILQHDHSKNILDVVATAGGDLVTSTILTVTKCVLYILGLIIFIQVTACVLRKVLCSPKKGKTPQGYDLVRYVNGPQAAVSISKASK
ncbi:putative glycoprotein [Hubei dimarhabdovirus virus 3]|uniref:putative glycoprotein n=1 Tax=Hubei dimarhabdovirus virus 3 TaxID=1922868 RepID=UPI00090C1DA6|nr:putative glycoprotein [Hubei dimarhabdovirus virus 3]APG78714.1 putative glycoprotein [Hubei dimarhabdovirus virus 3]